MWWLVARPYTRGVKCVVRDGDRALFVRHTYGNRRAWELPGGSLRRREPPEAAIRREMREELGVELLGLHELAKVEVANRGKRTLLVCFEGSPADGTPLNLDEGEIAEGRWAPLDAPPEPLGPDAGALLEAIGHPVARGGW